MLLLLDLKLESMQQALITHLLVIHLVEVEQLVFLIVQVFIILLLVMQLFIVTQQELVILSLEELQVTLLVQEIETHFWV